MHIMENWTAFIKVMSHFANISDRKKDFKWRITNFCRLPL